MLIQYLIKSVYGRELYYPANAAAQYVCKLTNTATLSAKHLEILRAMGCTVQAVEVQ